MWSYRAEERPIIYKDETYWVIQNDCGQVWQLCEWGTVNTSICMTFHKRAFDFFNFIAH
jgi:hypothetical protein